MVVDDPDDSHRHRWIPRRLIETHPRRAASMLSARMARIQLLQPIPSAWDRLGHLLRRPSEAEVGARAAEISLARAKRPSKSGDAHLASEVDDLTKLLAEADLIRDSELRESQKEIDRLEMLATAAEMDQYDDANELEALRRENEGLQRTLRLFHHMEQGADDATAFDPYSLPVPGSVTDAVEVARDRLAYVEIPATALRNVDELEGTAKYLVWASAIWQGIIALHEYASVKASGAQPAGFKLWCDETSAWPPSKLAMTESDAVQGNPELRDQRLFCVSTDVDESGRIHMLAHLKIQAGGGQNIPRLYFYDDTEGRTRKMHVGFIGPHRLVRNTRS